MGQKYTFAGWSFLANRLANPNVALYIPATSQPGTNSIQVNPNVIPSVTFGMTISNFGFPAGSIVQGLAVHSPNINFNYSNTNAVAISGTAVLTGPNNSFVPLTIHLLTGPLNITPDITFANLTEATYDGYTPQAWPQNAVIASLPTKDYAVVNPSRLTFQPVDYTVPNVITGHCFTWIDPATGNTMLLAVEVYPAGVPLQQPGDVLTINPLLSLPYDVSNGPFSPGIV